MAVDEALGAAWQTAVRPAHEPVPADADAVRFDDYAELLACLLADWQAGVMATRWWWVSFYAVRPRTAASSSTARVHDLLREHATVVPAAFELLAQRGLAVRVGRALPPDDALAVTFVVADEHRLPVTRERILSLLALTRRVSAASPGLPAWAATGAPAQPSPPAVRVREAAAPDLAPEQRLLLTVVLTIRRAPSVIRTRGFWRELEHRWATSIAPRPSHRASEVWREASQPAPGRPASERGRGLGPLPRTIAVGEPGSAAAMLRVPVAPDEPELDQREPPDPEPVTGGIAGGAASDPATRTRYAGLFYLMNVGLFLGLYGDFTQPRVGRLTLEPWDFVSLIGRRLLRRADDGDPVWCVLSELSGTKRPGAGFRAPRSLRVPPTWLEPLSDVRGAWRWHVSAGRLRVVHPAGFAAVDVPVAVDPAGQTRRELRRLGVTRRVLEGKPPAAADVTRGTERWAAWVSAYIAVRLRLARGARSARAAVATALERPGSVRVTPSRVDVTFPLDDLPIAIRLAGLDRSPGWIPAASRYLEFHFE
jgi:hypothetical protein